MLAEIRSLLFKETSEKTSKSLSRMVNSLFADSSLDKASPERQHDIKNLHIYLNAQKRYEDLMQMYNPLSSLTDAERVRMTANRVGLDVPFARTADDEKSDSNK